ncbi:glycerol kinase [Planctomyces bekefii]|uniref:ATP:glycerol 3-phosphotransferase n=1 Tax=Planctomyces bekefii TaxID=1653850 RepID=A0A5C6M6R7_9PLAN|nr:glycerol kinase [Planctomyces bekefii]
MGYILAIDQGTTGSTVLVVDVRSRGEVKVIGRDTIEFPQHFPETGWVEHDLEDIWQSVETAAKRALTTAATLDRDFRVEKIAAIGITNQRETLCAFDRASAAARSRAIVWQCKRSTDICQRLKADGLEKTFRERTGLVLDPYFSGTKITWLMENRPELAREIASGRTVLGTVDTFLVARLTGGKSFVTEPSNASRTLAFDIRKGTWDEELLRTLKIPSVDALAEVRDSASKFGVTKGLSFLPDGVPITGVLGDQQAALAGQTCFEPGEAKCTYGTGAFLLANLGNEPKSSRAGLLTTIAWSLGGKRTYAFEGAAFIAGAAVQFLRDQLQLLDRASESEALATGVQAAPEVYFVPALAGLGAPHWDPRAQGAFLGLTRGTTKAQMVRAVLDGIAFQVADLTDAIAADLGQPLKILRVDGGASANGLLMKSQAEFASVIVDQPTQLETTALGAALFAAMGAGIFSGIDELKKLRKVDQLFSTSNSADERRRVETQRAGWRRAIHAVQVFAGTAT